MKSLMDDGIEKVRLGVTTVAEVHRVALMET
jgi:type II secretory ATPase GspE/PulE/Tfp pilus assembly ATPase PilB-like protein